MVVPSSDRLHATTVAIDGLAVLIEGVSGSGKSDLALRLIDRGAILVSDDQTLVVRTGETLLARAPTTIAGRIEARGVGIVSVRTRLVARVVLAVACVPEAVERLPEPQTRAFAGVDLPLLALDPRPASAVDVVAAALETL